MTRNEAIRKAIYIIFYLKARFAKSQEARKDAEEIIEALDQINEEQRDRKVNKMSIEQLIEIAEKFTKWLNETSDEYQIGKDDLQSIIKSFLIG